MCIGAYTRWHIKYNIYTHVEAEDACVPTHLIIFSTQILVGSDGYMCSSERAERVSDLSRSERIYFYSTLNLVARHLSPALCNVSSSRSNFKSCLGTLEKFVFTCCANQKSALGFQDSTAVANSLHFFVESSTFFDVWYVLKLHLTSRTHNIKFTIKLSVLVEKCVCIFLLELVPYVHLNKDTFCHTCALKFRSFGILFGLPRNWIIFYIVG